MRRRRRDRWAPPLPGGKPPTEPLPIIELQPNPLPPPRPPVTREDTLADLQIAFASLTEDELKLARLWLVGESLDDVCSILRMREKAVRALWQSMRRKLRLALLDEPQAASNTPDSTTPEPQPSTGTPQGTGGNAPA